LLLLFIISTNIYIFKIKILRKYHPDKNPGDKEAEEKFLKVTEGFYIGYKTSIIKY